MTRTRSAVALLATLLVAVSANAVPTRYSADAGEVRDIRFFSGTGATAVLFASTQGGGVFRSANGGASWTATGLNAGYAWKVAASVVASTTTAYAATEAGLFKTTNANTATPTWTQLTFDPVRTVAVDPTSAGSDTVLIGVRGSGVLRSSDSGATWTRQSGGLDSSEPTHIVFNSGTSVAYVVLACNHEDVNLPYAGGGWGGVFKTTNAKAATIAWTNFNNGGGAGAALPSICLGAIDANATSVWIGVFDPFQANSAIGKVFRSAGAGWIAPAATIPATGNFFVGVSSIAVDRNVANTIHVGAASIGVWTSSDNGLNFSQKVDPTTGHDPEVYTRINAIESVPGLANTLLAGARGVGLMRSTNTNLAPGSIVWSAASGVTADRVRGLDNHAAVAQSTYWMALEQGGVFKAPNINLASPWQIFITGMDLGAVPLGSFDMLLSATSIAADPSNTSIVLVGTRGGGLLQLSGGTSWTQAGLPSTVTVGAIDIQPEHLLIPTSGKVYYSLFNLPAGGKGGGLMQSTTGPGGLVNTAYPEGILGCTVPSPGAGASAFKVVQTPSGVAYLLRYDGYPYRSTNAFTANNAPCIAAAHTGFERLWFHDLAEQPNNAAIVVAATNKGIFRSTDGGVNWGRLSISGLPTQTLSGLAFISNGILYGITRAGGLYCSSDNGVNWSTVALGGLPPASFRQIKVINGLIHVLTDGAGFYTGFAATCP